MFPLLQVARIFSGVGGQIVAVLRTDLFQTLCPFFDLVFRSLWF